MLNGTPPLPLRKFNMAGTKRTERKGTGVRRGAYEPEDFNPDQLGIAGIHLRQWRMHRDMTVLELSDKAGVSPGLISGAENAKNGLSMQSLKLIAEALGCSIGELMEIDPRKNGEEFWPLWRDASPAQRQRITDHAKGVVGKPKP